MINLGVCLLPRFEVNFDRLNQWDQPTQQLLMVWMPTIAVQRSFVREFHHAPELVSTPARRNIHPDVRFHQPRYFPLQSSNFGDDPLFLFLRYAPSSNEKQTSARTWTWEASRKRGKEFAFTLSTDRNSLMLRVVIGHHPRQKMTPAIISVAYCPRRN
jgi:hypothetical protein